ncbi:response regulator transcription factor [Leucobacter chromiiresistens]|uniref:DNA-binding response regulator, OmpR family, contains REC and winged-helix (WHTH) domain n=1 Tax=Leucobacter chromiiresistens TaxID=1079994 RepID=A0A1H0ZVM9_9MICO|nr:response regulator transcription factor [Leucobacter chromiiresistens]SDQ31535.1 DNA-binding response regulator, OmpR family, contains REC and winged-helix (wHTH) domain [Leucobacter chromiiresistens]
MRVLLVEDDAALGRVLRQGLSLEGFVVDLVTDGIDAVHATEVTEYDALVLDRDLPGMHGDDVCARLVDRTPTPGILMLTASDTLADRITGFEKGADDYLPKPFEFGELVARLRALGRRRADAVPPTLTAGDVELDIFRRTVRRRGVPIRVTPKEFAVLEVLMKSRGGVISAERLLEKAWDENANPFTNSVRVTVSTLRRKLGSPDAIVTVLGGGYRMRDAEE